ncbi:DUF3320 domain-containing protein [Arthrobacter sp. zg-Y1116]|uniref:DUF3320 domain-containing protein n=1 Tax=Arthrobacter sp. zg-Y1116 TaxID=2964611 RepID=UPI0021058A4A|nr:DUF3320 domain-containing protein [Arthrobacter sp. zg-Y1116]MCQ1947574.1 DUF3320 domain-containing protein [Arthrobacter sp. zg-Y1116]
MGEKTMSKHHVHAALDLLSERLDPFIQASLQDQILGLEWSSVLRELDQMKGKEGWTYSRRDLSLQLRMLTERLGALGYPFDAGDRNRTLSSYGSVLRIIRNRLSHGGEFEVFDALQAADTVRTVLTHIGDTDGADRAGEIRTAVIKDLLEASEPESEAVADSDDEAVPVPAGSKSSNAEAGNGVDVLYGSVPWESWTQVVVGEQEDLDSMRTVRVKENVRSLIEDIAEAEGPVHQDRVARLVGLAFGFSRLVPARMRRILNQIPRASVDVDSYGFVWPKGIDHSRWLIHRTGTGSARPFEQIAPTEIANAIVAVIKDDPSVAGADLRRRVLQQFGRKRSSKPAREQFELGLAYAKSSGRIQ